VFRTEIGKRSGKRSGVAEWAENRVERSGACVAENDVARAECGAGGRGAGTERGAG